MPPQNPQLPNPNQGTAFGWFTSWVAIILVMVLLARTSWGKPIVYYSAWLAVVILLLTHYQDFAAILAGGSSQSGS